jgi:hypothetical protein
LISEDKDEVIVVDDELIVGGDSEALELIVEDSPGYETGSSLETAELEVVELSG